jgi:tetratricopeptide (TPR) repeat protein
LTPVASVTYAQLAAWGGEDAATPHRLPRRAERTVCPLPAGQSLSILHRVDNDGIQHDAAIAEFERAFALNPNFVDFRYAKALSLAGEPARAIEVQESILRLDPFQPLGQKAGANCGLRRYDETVRLARE